jgi:glycerophosphoryl diester phosphodiesterase
MEAFELAGRAGADGIELDVRLAGSGAVVVCHDPTLERLTGGRDARAIAALHHGELAKIDLGHGQGVPLLTEVLALADRHRLRVNVEMKRDVPSRRRLVAQTVRVLRDRASPAVLVSSFDPWMLAYFGWLLPAVPCGYLFAPDQKYQRSGWPATLLRAAAMHPERSLCRAERIRLWRARGRLVNVWTVNDVGEARALSELGVDAVITDDPASLVGALR